MGEEAGGRVGGVCVEELDLEEGVCWVEGGGGGLGGHEGEEGDGAV